jgi:hypothetical protein
VNHHPDIGALGRPLAPHGVAEELAPDGDRVPLGLAPLDKRIDRLARHTAFDEDRWDLGGHERVHKGVDVLEAGLAVGADALDREHLQAVGTPEVPEGVMGGHHDPLVGGDGGDGALGVLVQFGQGCEVRRGVLGVEVLALGVLRDKRIAGPLRRLGPQGHVEPHVGVEVAGELRRLAEQLLVDGAGHLHHRLLLGHLDDDVRHAALQVQSVVEDHVGVGHEADIPGRGLVEVWVHALAHEAGDLGTVPCDIAGDVADHADGGDHLELARRGGLYRSFARRLVLAAKEG